MSKMQCTSSILLPFPRSVAGFPVSPDGMMSEALIDNLVVPGDETNVTSRLAELLVMGLDELLVMLVPVADAEGEQLRMESDLKDFLSR